MPRTNRYSNPTKREREPEPLTFRDVKIPAKKSMIPKVVVSKVSEFNKQIVVYDDDVKKVVDSIGYEAPEAEVESDQLTQTDENCSIKVIVEKDTTKFIASPRSMKHFSDEESDEMCIASSMIDYLQSAYSDESFSHTASSKGWLTENLITLSKHVASVVRSSSQKTGAIENISGPTYFIGDLHGNYSDLNFFLSKLLVFSDIRYTPFHILFLGDYVDRGSHSVEVTALLTCMKCLSPNTVHLLRGNHDDPAINTAVSDYHVGSFMYQCRTFAPTVSKGDKLLVACNKMFKSLSCAAIVGGSIFASHGGIPRYYGGVDDRISVLSGVGFPEFASVHPNPNKLNPSDIRLRDKQELYAWDLMWSDPVANDDIDCGEYGFGFNARGGTTISYNSKAVHDFLKNNNLTTLVRGHQECPAGVRVSSNGSVITVFSTSGYCGHSNSAAVAMYDSNGFRFVTKAF